MNIVIPIRLEIKARTAGSLVVAIIVAVAIVIEVVNGTAIQRRTVSSFDQKIIARIKDRDWDAKIGLRIAAHRKRSRISIDTTFAGYQLSIPINLQTPTGYQLTRGTYTFRVTPRISRVTSMRTSQQRIHHIPLIVSHETDRAPKEQKHPLLYPNYPCIKTFSGSFVAESLNREWWIEIRWKKY